MDKQVNNVGDFFGNLLSHIGNAIPAILGAGVILLIGYFVAKALSKVVDKLLDKVNLDGKLHGAQGGNMIQKAVPYPSNLVASIVFWLVFLFAISAAVGTLGVPLLTGVVAGIYAYIPKVIAAVAIFLVAGTVASAVAGLVQKTMGDTPTGKVVKTVVPIVIMAIAGFMILNQLMIAPAIVVSTYVILLGSAGLGLALAFGLGGRETAARMVSGAYDKAQENRNQVKSDVDTGKKEVKKQVEEVKKKAAKTDVAKDTRKKVEVTPQPPKQAQIREVTPVQPPRLAELRGNQKRL